MVRVPKAGASNRGGKKKSASQPHTSKKGGTAQTSSNKATPKSAMKKGGKKQPDSALMKDRRQLATSSGASDNDTDGEAEEDDAALYRKEREKGIRDMIVEIKAHMDMGNIELVRHPFGKVGFTYGDYIYEDLTVPDYPPDSGFVGDDGNVVLDSNPDVSKINIERWAKLAWIEHREEAFNNAAKKDSAPSTAVTTSPPTSASGNKASSKSTLTALASSSKTAPPTRPKATQQAGGATKMRIVSTSGRSGRVFEGPSLEASGSTPRTVSFASSLTAISSGYTSPIAAAPALNANDMKATKPAASGAPPRIFRFGNQEVDLSRPYKSSAEALLAPRAMGAPYKRNHSASPPAAPAAPPVEPTTKKTSDERDDDHLEWFGDICFAKSKASDKPTAPPKLTTAQRAKQQKEQRLRLFQLAENVNWEEMKAPVPNASLSGGEAAWREEKAREEEKKKRKRSLSGRGLRE